MFKSDSSSTPRVSVLLTTYNGAEHVAETVESVLSQTYDDWELVIINDGSTDQTREIIESFDDDRIRLFNQENRGRGPALNRGLGLARGKYVAIIDDDDIADSERLQEQVSFLDSQSDVDLVGTWYANEWNTEGNSDLEYVRPPTEHAELCETLPIRNPFAHSTVMYRKKAVLTVGGYREDLDSCLDYNLWVQLTAAGYKLMNLDESLVVIRKHEGQSFRVSGMDQLRYLVTMTATRFRAVKVIDAPVLYWGIPLVMLLWAILPEVIKRVVRGIWKANV